MINQIYRPDGANEYFVTFPRGSLRFTPRYVITPLRGYHIAMLAFLNQQTWDHYE